MKKILRHGESPGYHAKISCGLEIVSDDYTGLSVGLSSRKNHALSVVKGETKSRIESLPPIIRHERRCISEQTLALAGLDHQNRKTSISKPTASAQRPNVQAETTRTRLRRSCGFCWDRSVIATAPHCSNCWGRPLWTGGIPDNLEFKSQFRRPSIRLATSVLRCSRACLAFASALFSPHVHSRRNFGAN
jgi:hypothetical protein